MTDDTADPRPALRDAFIDALADDFYNWTQGHVPAAAHTAANALHNANKQTTP